MTVAIERDPDGQGRILQTQVVVPHPLERTFEFFADAANLEALTPPWLHFRIQSQLPPPGDLASGTLIDYRIRVHGIPIRWRTRIESWNAPDSFVDHQLRGPYRLWHHTHEFAADGPERTIMRDTVRYHSPLAWIADPLIVNRDLRRIFAYREARLIELLGSA